VAALTPAPTASPTPGPTASPSTSEAASASPLTPSPTPTPVPSPTPTPTPSASPTPEPTATPTPTPVPTVVPTAPQHEIRLASVGLDDKSLGGSVPRILTFEIDGPTLLHSAVTNATAPVQLCVWREAVDDQRMCDTGKSVVLDRAVTDSNGGLWHVSLIGAKGFAPSAGLTVDFNANAPSVTFDNFRYYGTSNSSYDGFTAGIDAGVGQLTVQGAFDDGQGGSYDYRYVVTPDGQAAIVDQTGGPTTSFAFDPVTLAAGSYSVTIQDPDDVANPGMAVFIAATITWP
jgi:hypothetical protein